MLKYSYTLLVVDDLADNRELLRRQFERHGFTVEEAEDGEAALSKIEQTRFDIVLLDINMPGLDGVEVLARIRQTYKENVLPVIMLTASNQIADVVRARKHGANSYLIKPIDPAAALANVKALLNVRGKVEV